MNIINEYNQIFKKLGIQIKHVKHAKIDNYLIIRLFTF